MSPTFRKKCYNIYRMTGNLTYISDQIILDSGNTEPNNNVSDENLILNIPERVVKPPKRFNYN